MYFNILSLFHIMGLFLPRSTFTTYKCSKIILECCKCCVCNFICSCVLRPQHLGEKQYVSWVPILNIIHHRASRKCKSGAGMHEAEPTPCCIQESNLILMDWLFLDLPKCSVLLQVSKGIDTRRCEQLRAGEGFPYNCISR